MNTTPEKLAQVLKLYEDIFHAGNPSAANQNTRGNDYQATDTDYFSGKSAMVPMGPWIYSNRTTGDVAKKILEEQTGVIRTSAASRGDAGDLPRSKADHDQCQEQRKGGRL